jgi:hypothetical protein
VNPISLSPVVAAGSFPERVISPRRARTLTYERPLPFIVDRPDDAPPAEPAVAAPPVDRGIRLVFGGWARRPVFVAGIVGLAGVAGIGLFLGLMLGNLL